MANGISSMNLEKAIQKRNLPSNTNNNNPRSNAGLSRRRRNNSVRAGNDNYRRRGTDASGSKRELEGEEANTDIYYRKYNEEHEQEDAEVEEDAHSNTLAEDQKGLENNGTSTTSDTAPETDYILEDIYYYDKTVYYYYDDDDDDADKGEGDGGYAPAEPIETDIKNQTAYNNQTDLNNQTEQVVDEEEDYYITKTTYYYYDDKKADDAGLTTSQSDESQLDQQIQTRHYAG